MVSAGNGSYDDRLVVRVIVIMITLRWDFAYLTFVRGDDVPTASSPLYLFRRFTEK